jgi:hypothetical protein
MPSVAMRGEVTQLTDGSPHALARAMHRMTAPGIALALLGLAAPAAAQRTRNPPPAVAASCEGRTVTRIDIVPGRPPFSGAAAKWRAAARAVGLHHTTTRERVIAAFLALHLGEPCTDFRRAESERVLRAQPFIGDAKVTTEPDSAGGVAVHVETTDEVPVLVGGRFRGASPEVLSLGNGNVAGQGLRAEATWERARGYRTGVGVRLAEYAAFDRPYVAKLEAYRHRIGSDLLVDLGHPFFTDLQRISWHAGARSTTSYVHVERPAHDPLALEVEDRRWDVSGVARVFGTGTVALLGGAVTGRRLVPGGQGVIVSDSGFVADTGTALAGRYRRFSTMRAGVIVGVRRVRFVAERGFDALTGPQDVPSGVAGGLYVARGFPSMGESDVFLSATTYAGVARSGLLLANLAEVEGRRDMVTHEWNSIVGSTRSALYLGEGPGMVMVLSDELSGGVRSRLPLQLTLSDRRGGVVGYRASGLAGARRNVARGEVRRSWSAAIKGADVGVAGFGEVGTLWAGDAPYGWTGSRGSLGLSLLAAYPSRSKRVYRVDVGFPLTRGGAGGGKIEVRFSSDDRTIRFWDEPDDVARSRTGIAPSILFAWPAR